jgi:hypothetical protein
LTQETALLAIRAHDPRDDGVIDGVLVLLQRYHGAVDQYFVGPAVAAEVA